MEAAAVAYDEAQHVLLGARMFLTLGLHGTVCDIGCGPMTMAAHLVPSAGRYVGVDIRPFPPIKGVEFHCTVDMKTLNLDCKFDFMFADNLVIHLTDSHVEALFDFVKRHLKPDSAFYAAYWEGPHKAWSDWDGFPCLQRPIEFFQGRGLEVVDIGTRVELGAAVVAGGLADEYIMQHARVLKGTL